MKLALITLSLLASTHAMSAVDYSYCQQAVNIPSIGEGYEPLVMLTDDGKIKAGPMVKSYKEDSANRTETIIFGEKPMKGKIIVMRDEAGVITKFIQSTDFDAPEVKMGVGAKRKGMGVGYGMGMAGFGMGGFGMGGYGMGVMQDSSTNIVTDFKIQNGKCVPSRSLMETKTGKVTDRHFLSDLQLCRDMKTFFKKNPDAAACFGNKFNDSINEIMKGHHARNADVYKPEENKTSDKKDPFAGYGEYPGLSYDGGGFNNPGMSFNSAGGGYGMYLDNLATAENFPGQQSALTRGQMIMQYCEMPYGPMSKMIADEALFAAESKEAQASSAGVSK